MINITKMSTTRMRGSITIIGLGLVGNANGLQLQIYGDDPQNLVPAI